MFDTEKHTIYYRFHFGDDLDEFPPIRSTDQARDERVYGLKSWMLSDTSCEVWLKPYRVKAHQQI